MIDFQVGNIYLLMREKRGKSVDQRLEDLTHNEVNVKLIVYDVIKSIWICDLIFILMHSI